MLERVFTFTEKQKSKILIFNLCISVGLIHPSLYKQVTSNLSPILWMTFSFKMKRNVTYPRKKLRKLRKQMENLTSKQKSSSKCWMTLRFSNKLWNIHNMQKIHFRPSAPMLKIKCYWKQEWIPKKINHHCPLVHNHMASSFLSKIIFPI